jgi:hypothetical protein
MTRGVKGAVGIIFDIGSSLPSKRAKKMSENCFFRIHYKEFCVDSEKNTFFRFFAEVLFPEKLFRN